MIKGSGDVPRRGTLADLGRSFAGGGKARRPETDFMSKIRKRRETSADITVLRKGSATVTDLKSDISKYVIHQLHYQTKKPLNLITLGQTESDNTSRMITITSDFYLVSISKCFFNM